MDCEKYAKHVTDCALGQLAPALESEVMGHMANCPTCRLAHERAQSAADLMNRGMDLLVAGQPSAHFAARLYARIAGEPATGSFWARRFPVAASVLLCVSLAAVVVMTNSKRDANQAPERKVEAVVSGSSSNVNAAGRSAAALHGPHPGESRPYTHASIAAQPEALVLPGQMAALDRFDEALRRYQAAGARAIAQQGDADQPMKVEQMKITPLEIKPIEVPAIPDSTNSWGGF